MVAKKWGEWLPLPEEIGGFSSFEWEELLNGGQAFRWNLTHEGFWQGQWLDNVIQLHGCPKNQPPESKWRTLALADEELTKKSLLYYLGTEKDHASKLVQLPRRSDPVLDSAIMAFPKLRILKQPLEEVLLGFLLSSSKQIPHIKEICERLAYRYGKQIAKGFSALPTWVELRKVPEEELRDCKLGYRASYIHKTAEILEKDPNFLKKIKKLPYSVAKETLIQLPGVGSKIADCVLLFGAGFSEAFPIDTWITKILIKQYQLQGWTNSQMLHFAKIHFGKQAGLAQQFLFSYWRSKGR